MNNSIVYIVSEALYDGFWANIHACSSIYILACFFLVDNSIVTIPLQRPINLMHPDKKKWLAFVHDVMMLN